ncbi:substrate-binding domain-containing protein [Desulforhopalus vacuolatus]|uniref:substrate-binding domain-containing protein n=1 Tax=Desulforhopalus vacuolatus TaxID=40414 RepID=UPI00196455DF|nr:substrate-binding domain-containing protein [Desulforhopalus vacuolatus]MBM9521259.1 substrate-binding domain-containing protein [Desulforhopalus vacuolatus]
MKSKKNKEIVNFSFLTAFIFLLFMFNLLLFIPNANAGNEGTIALVMKALSNPFFSKMEEGAKKYAIEENIPLEVFGVERETDVERQIGICENLISRGYGAIVIAPADSKKLVPICKKAIEKNIIVINIDNPLHQETMKQLGVSIPFVGSDNRVGAGMIGTYFKDKLAGQGRVIVIEGIRGVENAELRKKGFIEKVTQDSTIQIAGSETANWHTDEALSVTTELLRKHKTIDAIFCANDQMALGALQAIDIMGLTGTVLIAGYDNIESARNEIRNDRIHATIEQHPELMGEYGVKLAWKALNGQKIPFYEQTPLDLITYESFNKKIALSISNLKNSFFSTLLKGAQEAADLYGVQLLVKDAQNSDPQQLMDIADLLTKKIDLLIVNPTNTESVMPGIEMANKKNIPVITADRKASGGKILCHIESDNIEGGKMAVGILAQHFKGDVRVVEIEGIPGTSACYERGLGFNEELQKYPRIKIIARDAANFDRKEAQEVMQRILLNDNNFDAVFAHNDHMILGVIDALKKSEDQRQRILIGFDAIREAKEAVQQGLLTATIAQKPEIMGKLSIETAVQYFRGKEINPTLFVDLSVITK